MASCAGYFFNQKIPYLLRQKRIIGRRYILNIIDTLNIIKQHFINLLLSDYFSLVISIFTSSSKNSFRVSKELNIVSAVSDIRFTSSFAFSNP